MTEIDSLKRYIPTMLLKCCGGMEDHWKFISFMEHTLCECSAYYSKYSDYHYIFCNTTKDLYVGNLSPQHRSCHNPCPKNTLLLKRKEAIIVEIRCLYNKLRIVEDDLTTDCIRYIILREIDESNIV